MKYYSFGYATVIIKPDMRNTTLSTVIVVGAKGPLPQH